MDKGIENLLARLRTALVTDRHRAKFERDVDQALTAMYEAGRAEVARDQAPCEAVVRLPGTEDNRLAVCMRLAGHAAPHESADGCQWWSPADGSALAAVGRSDDAGATSGSGPELGQADIEG
ncbi:MAG TPA: hypothetical protein VF506_00150 [Streptosporangiaceae bacterium]